MATIERCSARSSPDAVFAVLQRDGAVIVEDLLSPDIVEAVNHDVEAAVDGTDPDADWFNPLIKAFHGPHTRAVSAIPAISPAFAVDVMCHPLLLELCDRIL